MYHLKTGMLWNITRHNLNHLLILLFLLCLDLRPRYRFLISFRISHTIKPCPARIGQEFMQELRIAEVHITGVVDLMFNSRSSVAAPHPGSIHPTPIVKVIVSPAYRIPTRREFLLINLSDRCLPSVSGSHPGFLRLRVPQFSQSGCLKVRRLVP